MRCAVAFLTSALVALTGCGGRFAANVPAALDADAGSSCITIRARKPYAPAYAATMWPTEHHDAWRTHSAEGGLGTIHGALHAVSVRLPPAPVWGYVGLDRKIYVLGGAPYLLDVFTKLILGAPQASLPILLAKSLRYSKTVTPYVAQIDPDTMAVKTLTFTRGDSVNYIGGMLVDANGYLYADARGILYKIDPKTFTVVASKRLPLAPDTSGKPNLLTAYNGMQATAAGDLILKGFASLGSDTGVMVLVNSDDLSIKVKQESTQFGTGARMVVASDGTAQYVYVPGATDSSRFLIGSNSFTVDNAFSQQYLFPKTGDTAASSDVFMGRGVVFSDNTDPNATSPMSIFAQQASDGSQLHSQQAFSAATEGWNFFNVAGDAFATGIVAVQNQVDGHISGFRACGGGTSTRKLWENDSIDGSAGMAIDSASGELYSDDHHCTTGGTCSLSLVVLDIRTGKELARVRVAGSEPTIGQIFIGPHGRVFHLATETNEANGYITRVTAR